MRLLLISIVFVCSLGQIRGQNNAIIKSVSVGDPLQTTELILDSIRMLSDDPNALYQNVFKPFVQTSISQGKQEFAEQVFSRLKSSNLSDTVQIMLLQIRGTFYGHFNPVRKLDVFKEMLDKIEKTGVFEEQKINTMVEIANEYISLNDYENAVSYLSEIDPQSITDTISRIDYLNSTGLLYLKMGMKDKSLGNFNAIIDLGKKINDPFSLAMAHSGISIYYTNAVHIVDSSLHHIRISIRAFEKAGYPQYTIGLYCNMGELFLEQKKLDSAQHYLHLAHKLSNAYGTEFELMNVSKNLGLLAIEESQYRIGLNWCKQAIQLGHGEMSQSFTASCYNCLSQAFEGLKVYDSALIYARLHHIYEDSIFNAKDVRDITLSEVEYEKKLVERERERENAVNQAKLARERYYKNMALLIGLVVLVVATALVYAYLKAKRSRRHIEAEKEYLDNLLHNLVHEFRTPLTLIQGPVSDMQKKDPENVLLEIVYRNAGKMLALVNQVLDFAKIKVGKLQIVNETTNVPLLIKDTISAFQPTAHDKNIRITMEHKRGVSVVGIDSDKLYKILSNLISNALKFTGKSGSIRIELDSTRSLIKIAVSDTGIGLKKEDQKHIFDKFYQVDATSTRKSEGTGLGLTFVHELIELMGGRITVQSTYGQGSTFTVYLPATEIQETLAEEIVPVGDRPVYSQQPEAEYDEDTSTILVIEDNSDLRNYLHLLLSPNYQVVLAEDGQEGIDKALEFIPDLIISDVLMPQKDGFQVVKTLKSDIRTDHIPIILLTAKASFDSKIRGFSYGADVYLSKPFSSDELKLRVANQLVFLRKQRERYSKNENLANTIEAPAESPFIKHLRDYVEKHLDEQITPDQLSRHINISRSQLHRKLKAISGLSATNFVNRIKLDYARKVLMTEEKNVSEIAYALGYSDPAYFSKLFKKQFNVSPSDVKKQA